MKLVNPLGRDVSDMFDGGKLIPMACMCSGGKAYATSRGKNNCSTTRKHCASLVFILWYCGF